MTITAKDEYKASFDQVYKLLTDQAFLEKKYQEGVGSRNIVFEECKQDGEVFRIRWARDVPADPPSFAKAFLSAWNHLTEVMEWRDDKGGGKEALYRGKIKGVPITIYGEFHLKPSGSGCVEDIEMEAEVSVPLIGGKIAELVERDAKKNLTGEYNFTLKYLKEV
jgi:hypothetical protein